MLLNFEVGDHKVNHLINLHLCGINDNCIRSRFQGRYVPGAVIAVALLDIAMNFI
jgi:hypothetical protein